MNNFDINRIKYYLATTGKKAGKYHYRYYKGNSEYMHIGQYDNLLTEDEKVIEYEKAFKRYYDNIEARDNIEEYDIMFLKNKKRNLEAEKYSDPLWWKSESKKSLNRISERFK